MTTVLVAGATGILGREVVDALRGRGHRIRTLSRRPDRAAALRGIVDEIVLGDATRPDTLDGVLDGVDAVVSCLGAPMAFTRGDRRPFHDVDTVANLNLVRAARHVGVARFVYVSLHLGPGWADTAYVRAHEAVVDELRRAGPSFAVVRPTGMFPIFDPLLALARQGVAWVPGDGGARTNPVHPREVARVCADTVLDTADDSVPVGGPEVFTRREMVEMAFAAVGRRPRILRVPPPALRAAAVAMHPVHPRLAEVLEFVTGALTSDFVAPPHGSLRLVEHFHGYPRSGACASSRRCSSDPSSSGATRTRTGNTTASRATVRSVIACSSGSVCRPWSSARRAGGSADEIGSRVQVRTDS